MKLQALVWVLLLGLAGCNCSGQAGGGADAGLGAPIPGVSAIRIDPATADLTTDGVTPARQAFTVTASLEAGGTRDVTAQALLTLSNPALGHLEGGTFVSGTNGGVSKLTAQIGMLTALATITVKVVHAVVVPPAMGGAPIPSDPNGVFTRAPNDPARAPTLVYPNDGTMLPSNLGSIEVHFKKARDDTLFRIRFESPTLTLDVFLRCAPLGAGCLYTLPADQWTLLAESNKGLPPVTLTVSGTDDQGGGAGTSTPFAISIAPVPVQGGLYYWTTSNGTGIERIEFGVNAPPARYFPFSGGGCFGCHALSRNGKQMSLSQNGQHDGRLTLIDVTSDRVELTGQDAMREQFQSWAPSSDRFVGAYGDDNPPSQDLRIRDGASGQVLDTIHLAEEPSHPDWSPAGDRIAFTAVTHHETSQRPGRGGISYVKQNGAAWSAEVALVPPEDGKNRYYPSYSPDAQFLVFDESTCDPGSTYGGECDADSDPSSKLWAIPADGGNRTLLAHANQPGVSDGTNTDLTNSFPRWAPFVDPRTADGSGRLMWMTFSSRRHYGLRAPDGTDLWLWMVAVDPDKVMAGADGSYTAFALPFQDLGTSNHIAQWAAQIVPSTPSGDGGIPNGGADGGPGDGGPDHGRGDGGMCLAPGDVCDPNNNLCCAGSRCTMNGPGLYLCRPAF